jgi:hypothetical protein
MLSQDPLVSLLLGVLPARNRGTALIDQNVFHAFLPRPGLSLIFRNRNNQPSWSHVLLILVLHDLLNH